MLPFGAQNQPVQYRSSAHSQQVEVTVSESSKLVAVVAPTVVPRTKSSSYPEPFASRMAGVAIWRRRSIAKLTPVN